MRLGKKYHFIYDNNLLYRRLMVKDINKAHTRQRERGGNRERERERERERGGNRKR